MEYYIAKCIVIGDSGTGKTSITQRLVKGFKHKMKPEHDVTIGVDFDTYYSKVKYGIQPEAEVGVKMQIWDTAG